MKIIVVEGIDGSGKSTLINNLKIMLEENTDYKVYVYKPIGETPSSLAVREYLDNSNDKKFTSGTHIIYSYLTAMIETMDNIQKHKDEDCIVLMDRWVLSTLAYGLISFEEDDTPLYNMIKGFLDLVEAVDVTIHVDIDVDIALSRLQTREGSNKDYYSNEQKLRKISSNYMSLILGYSSGDIVNFSTMTMLKLFGKETIFVNNNVSEKDFVSNVYKKLLECKKLDIKENIKKDDNLFHVSNVLLGSSNDVCRKKYSVLGKITDGNIINILNNIYISIDSSQYTIDIFHTDGIGYVGKIYYITKHGYFDIYTATSLNLKIVVRDIEHYCNTNNIMKNL